MTDKNVTAEENKNNGVDQLEEGEVIPLTQVTSFAEEEQKTGEKRELPSPEVIANNAMKVFIRAMMELNNKLYNKSISKISIAKAVLAGLDLPEENVPVNLKSNEEKEIFGLVQQAVNTRFLLTQFHISNRRKELLEQQTQGEKV